MPPSSGVSVTDKLSRLLAVLRRDPDLLYEVAVAIRHEKVVSGWLWHPDDYIKKYRADPSGKKHAILRRHPTRTVFPWETLLSKVDPETDRPEKHFQTETEALRWADEQLIARGYLLS